MCGYHHLSSFTQFFSPIAVVVPCVEVPLSDHPVLLQVQAGLEEPWLGCDAEPTKAQYILYGKQDNIKVIIQPAFSVRLIAQTFYKANPC